MSGTAGVSGTADDGYIGLPRAADLLGVHYMTAYRYVRTGRLRATLVGGVWRIDPADVLALAGMGGSRSSTRGRSRALEGRRAPGNPSNEWPEMLEHCLVEGDDAGAFDLWERALASWARPADLYTEILVPTMRTIGERWSKGELSVADEHRASAVAVRLVGRLGPKFLHPGRRRGSLVVGAPAGEHHSIPAFIVSDLLRDAGFSVVDLGADAPSDAFVAAAKRSDRLVAIAIGSTLPGNEPAITDVVSAVQDAMPGIPVILGGAGIATQAAARRLGADLWSGADGREVVRLAVGL